MKDNELLSVNLWQRMRIHFVAGYPLGRLFLTPLAQAKLTGLDIFVALAQHKEGPWDGVGAQWHDCCEQGLDLPVRDGWERVGHSLYSGLYTQAGQMVLVRTAPDRRSTTLLLGEEEGCSGWFSCALCQEKLRQQREAEYGALAQFVTRQKLEGKKA